MKHSAGRSARPSVEQVVPGFGPFSLAGLSLGSNGSRSPSVDIVGLMDVGERGKLLWSGSRVPFVEGDDGI